MSVIERRRPLTKFGKRLERILAKHKMSKAELARRAEISYSSIVEVVAGTRSGEMTIPKIEKVLEELERRKV